LCSLGVTAAALLGTLANACSFAACRIYLLVIASVFLTTVSITMGGGGYWGLNTVGVPSVSFSSRELMRKYRSGSLSGA